MEQLAQKLKDGTMKILEVPILSAREGYALICCSETTTTREKSTVRQRHKVRKRFRKRAGLEAGSWSSEIELWSHTNPFFQRKCKRWHPFDAFRCHIQFQKMDAASMRIIFAIFVYSIQ